MIRLCALSVVAVFILTGLGSCGGFGAGDEEGNDFVAPLDTRDNEALQGVYDCSERGDTGYRQGDSFPIRVVSVDGKPAEVATANAYIALQDAARADGISLRIVSGFRTMDEQEYFYSCYTNCNCNNCNLAARPGYSNHQSGHAFDLNTSDSGVLSWLNNHGAAFGWSRTVPSEAWHWEWWGAAADYDGPCGAPAVPAGCVSGTFDGAFCDDDGAGSEEAHNCLVDTLEVDFACADVSGSPAYCGGDTASRAEALFVLGRAAGMPEADGAGTPFEDAFVDDNGHRYEVTLNAGKHWNVLRGDAAGHATPDGSASRSTVAILLMRIYDLPATNEDFFSDDDGSDAEDAHNRIAALGFSSGCGAGEGGRRRFCGSDPADRSALARFACGAAGFSPVAVWDRPVDEPGEVPGEEVGEEPGEEVGEEPGDGPAPIGDDTAPPESEPVELPPSVSQSDGCAQTASTTWLPALLLVLRRRRR